MKPTENYKDVEINGRTFRIKKFNALTGGFMVFKITGILAPLFKSVDIGKLMNMSKPMNVKELSEVKPEALNDPGIMEALNIPGIMEGLGSLSEDDFNYVQGKCLQVCSELLAAGPTPVLNQNGTFGVVGLEEDTMAVLALTVHSLIFNVKGFFQGSPLASMLGGLLTITPQD